MNLKFSLDNNTETEITQSNNQTFSEIKSHYAKLTKVYENNYLCDQVDFV